MNTYKNSIPSSYKKQKSPLQEEIERNICSFNLTVTTEIDTDTLSLFKHIPNLIAFKTTLKKGNEMISVGTGASVLNQFNKFLTRTVKFAYNASIIDAIVRSTKILDALSILPTIQKDIENNEIDLEGRDERKFYSDEDMPQFATEKQKNFLTKLINEQCDNSEKEEYQNRLKSPYLSKFDCSELIKELMPTK